MDTATLIPRFEARAPELRRLFEPRGPFLSVYLGLQPDIENPSQISHRRWNSLRDALTAQGAPEAALTFVDPLIPTAHELGATLAVIATADELLHVEHGAEAPRDLGRWAALPSIAPLIRRRQSSPPYVMVLTDRRGADIVAVELGREPITQTLSGSVDEPIRKVAPGGWSQRRYQQRAENTWEHHAHEIADMVTALCDQVHPEVVLIGGDVRAVQLLEEHLPRRVTQIVHHVPGGRAPDGSDELTLAAAHRWVATAAARDTVVMLERFREEVGQADRATNGPDDTLRALTAGQVAILLVHDDPDDAREGWFGPQPTPVDRSEAVLRELGIDAPTRGRLVDVAIRAALGTGAAVWIVPAAGGPRDGLGALLRWR